MVDLEPLSGAQDVDRLRALIERHAELTGSPRARWILDNWYGMLPRFVKVFPHEFKRVLGVPRTADATPLTLTRPVVMEQEAPRG